MNKFYNCLKATLYPPKNFIKYNSRNDYKDEVFVDACLADEILKLWSNGIRTTGCCCGHGSEHISSFIMVQEEDIEKMEKLGYQHRIMKYIDSNEFRNDCFIPKSTIHYFDGYDEFLHG